MSAKQESHIPLPETAHNTVLTCSKEGALWFYADCDGKFTTIGTTARQKQKGIELRCLNFYISKPKNEIHSATGANAEEIMLILVKVQWRSECN